jgi:hypothetical protein
MHGEMKGALAGIAGIFMQLYAAGNGTWEFSHLSVVDLVE